MDVVPRMAENITRVGWSVMAIHAETQKGGRPTLAYTVGLTETFGHPELFMMGFAPDLMYRLLNDTAVLLRTGARFSDWSSSDQVIQGFPVYFRQLAQADAVTYALLAVNRYPKGFELLQMFLPDKVGLFPWDGGCDHGMAEFQGGAMVGMKPRLS